MLRSFHIIKQTVGEHVFLLQFYQNACFISVAFENKENVTNVSILELQLVSLHTG